MTTPGESEEQGRWPALHLMVEVDRPSPETAADGRWQEGFDVTQAEARVELNALEADLKRLKDDLDDVMGQRDDNHHHIEILEKELEAAQRERETLLISIRSGADQQMRLEEQIIAAEADLERLRARVEAELRRSMEETHGLTHDYLDSDGVYIEFERCSLWVCKQNRKRLAEFTAKQEVK